VIESVAFTAVLLGLLSAISWGTGDFIGGYLSRRMSALFVVVVVEMVGVVGLTLAAGISAEPFPDRSDLLFSAAAGIVGAAAITTFYRGLALYPMGLIAPLTAVLTGLVPVVFGIFLEGLPGGLPLLGMVLALAAVWLITGESGRSGPVTAADKRVLIYSITAGFGFGSFFILFDRVSPGAVYWPVVASRLTSMLAIGALLLIRRQSVRAMLVQLSRRLVGIIILGGILDAAGNVFFILAAQSGRLDISSVLASLFPVTTVTLAWAFLRESLDRRRLAGLAAAVTAVVLISA